MLMALGQCVLYNPEHCELVRGLELNLARFATAEPKIRDCAKELAQVIAAV
jgi:hypothetical protein